MKVVIVPPPSGEIKYFDVKIRVLIPCQYVPLALSNFCNDPENRDVSAVRHGAAVNRLHVRCMQSGQDLIRYENAGMRLIRETQMNRSGLLNIKNNTRSAEDGNGIAQKEVEVSGEQLFTENPLSTRPSLLETLIKPPIVQVVCGYLIFMLTACINHVLEYQNWRRCVQCAICCATDLQFEGRIVEENCFLID